jgi:hypothetical protein
MPVNIYSVRLMALTQFCLLGNYKEYQVTLSSFLRISLLYRSLDWLLTVSFAELPPLILGFCILLRVLYQGYWKNRPSQQLFKVFILFPFPPLHVSALAGHCVLRLKMASEGRNM